MRLRFLSIREMKTISWMDSIYFIFILAIMRPLISRTPYLLRTAEDPMRLQGSRIQTYPINDLEHSARIEPALRLVKAELPISVGRVTPIVSTADQMSFAVAHPTIGKITIGTSRGL